MQKLKFPTFLLALALRVASVQAQSVENHSFTNFGGSASLSIPDGNTAGASDDRIVVSAISSITSIAVDLVTTDEFNGDLYGYLRHSSGFSVLLNRPGRTTANNFGYADSGFNVQFTDTAGNGDIHLYQAVVTPASGAPLTGVWAPDGRNADPDLVVDTTPRNSMLNSFNGLDANGTWTLFLMDDSSGGTSTLNSWGLEITGVPEPRACVLATVLGVIAFGVKRARMRMRRAKVRLY